MRKILLSFKTDVYDRVVAGTKIYEHRRVFPNEPIEAYLYVSSPKQVITGKMILKNKQQLIDWLEKYESDSEVCERISSYLQFYSCVMEIAEFQETTEIPLSELRSNLEKFIIPQMYYYIDDSPLLNYIEDHLLDKELHIVNDFSDVDKKYICNG